MKKEPLHIVLPNLGLISLQARVKTKIRNTMKDTLNCCKLQVTFKRGDDLMSGVVYEYTCG